MLLGGVEKNNPEALLTLERDNMRKQIANFNTGLAAQAGLVETLSAKQKSLTIQVGDLEKKIKLLLSAGKKELAAQLALKYQTAKASLESVKSEYITSEEQYKELLKTRDIAIKTAQNKIDSISAGIDSMKIMKAKAELNEMATGLVSDIGGAGDNLNRIQEMVEEERTKASGRARVAQDTLDNSDIAIQADQLQADADMALADFEASLGLSKLTEEVDESTKRTMATN